MPSPKHAKTQHSASAYKKAGVDIEVGDALVDWLSDRPEKVKPNPSVVSGIGGFAALFRANFQHMKAPLLVSSTDGVGTKVKLASELKRYDGIGQDLVGMCVNDLACVGAEPLFFLDYYACGKLDLKAAKAFLTGLRAACDYVGCALIGGETAEMPGVYHKNDFDCAGFSVGVVDESEALGAHRVKVGNRLIGVASSGFHSNGYSLIRKLYARDFKKHADMLMTPTKLYSPLVKAVRNDLHAVAHVTGGGLDNLTRVIPDGTGLELNAWPVPKQFLDVKKRGKMKWPELLRTLNCGVGLVIFVAEKDFDSTIALVRGQGHVAHDLGSVVKAKKKDWHISEKELDGNSN